MISKKVLLTTLLSIVCLSLAACSSLQLPWSAASSSSQSAVSSGASGLSVDTRLAAGTLKLEKTDLAIKPEQAKQLAFLWKGVKALASSDTTSTQEMSALYQQIKDSMTAEQVKAIDQMTLTSADVTALVKELGAQMGAVPGQTGAPGAAQGPNQGQRSASGTGSTNRSQAQAGGGFMPGGMPPGDFGGGFPGQNASGAAAKNGTTTGATTGATTGQTSGARVNRLGNAQVIEMLIRILEERAKG